MTWWMVRHVIGIDNYWTNFYGPFRSKDAAQAFIKKARRKVNAHTNSFSFEILIRPSDFDPGN